ncbi:MAG: HEPN domain-containing protein [Coriobacteriales bacterium]
MASAQTLYDKAAANLRSAQIIFAHVDDDEEQLNVIGYHLQQALELLLKYLLEQNGIEYPKTHDIEQLIYLGNEAKAELYLTEYLEDHAEMFSQWEAKSRYVIGYAIEARKVERALREVDEYLTIVAERETEEIEGEDE